MWWFSLAITVFNLVGFVIQSESITQINIVTPKILLNLIRHCSLMSQFCLGEIKWPACWHYGDNALSLSLSCRIYQKTWKTNKTIPKKEKSSKKQNHFRKCTEKQCAPLNKWFSFNSFAVWWLPFCNPMLSIARTTSTKHSHSIWNMVCQTRD